MIKSSNGNLFGGFNATDWVSSGRYTMDNDCFLFSLKNTLGTPPTLIPAKIGNPNHVYGVSKHLLLLGLTTF